MSRSADQDEYVVLRGVPPEVYVRVTDALDETHNRHAYDRGTLEIRRVLNGVTSEQYRAFLNALEDFSIRHSYDGWNLEMMSPRKDHEWIKGLVARMIELAAFDRGIILQTIGSTTLQAEGAQRGVQPDECYYVQHESAVRGKDEYEPAIDPPPDLAIEVDVTHSSIKRMPIFAELGVPELWRHDGRSMQFFRLGDDGEYHQILASIAFPFLTPNDFNRFIDDRKSQDEHSLLRAFLDHVRTK